MLQMWSLLMRVRKQWKRNEKLVFDFWMRVKAQNGKKFGANRDVYSFRLDFIHKKKERKKKKRKCRPNVAEANDSTSERTKMNTKTNEFDCHVRFHHHFVIIPPPCRRR